jgi:hypothetical protein
MRTTVTLDPDVAEKLRKRVIESGQSMKAVLNGTLRAGFLAVKPEPERKKFRVKARRLGLRPGIDPARLLEYVNDLEDREIARKMGLR